MTADQIHVGRRDKAAKLKLVRSLIDFGTDAVEEVPALVAVLDDKEDDIASAAIQALVAIRPDAIPQLAQALAHPNVKVRSAVHLYAVSNFPSSAAGPFVPNLIAMLKDVNESNRIDAGSVWACQ